MTAQDEFTETGQFLASIAVREITGEARKTMVISVPTGMLIQPGVRIQVDGGQPQEAKFGVCFPNACFAEMVIDDNLITSFKRGSELTLTTFNQQAREVKFALTLVGFTAAYEGEPIAAEALQRRNETLQNELQKRADAARQRLIEEQRRASENAAPQQ